MDSVMQQPGLLGKMPAHGDFVRVNVAGTIWRLFDGWLQEGLYIAQQKNRLNQQFDDAPGYAFVFSPANDSQSLVGYLKPSRDQIGRKYPLILARTIEHRGSDAAAFRRLPVLYERFVSDAQSLVDRASRGEANRQDVVAQMEHMTRSGDYDGADSSYSGFVAETSWRDICVDAWGAFDASTKYLLFKNLNDLVSPLRAGVPPQYTLGLRFPGGSEKTGHAHTVAFWVDLIFRSLQHAQVTPSFFWRLPSAGERALSSLLAFFRSPTPRVLSEMMPDEVESDNICDLDRIGLNKVEEARGHLPALLGEMLDNPEARLQDLRQLIG